MIIAVTTSLRASSMDGPETSRAIAGEIDNFARAIDIVVLDQVFRGQQGRTDGMAAEGQAVGVQQLCLKKLRVICFGDAHPVHHLTLMGAHST